MILEMVVWGFFSAWGWIGANYVKDQIWPPEPTVQEQQQNTVLPKNNKNKSESKNDGTPKE